MPQQTITGLLRRVSKGSRAAEKELYELLYEDLHEAAGRFMLRQPPGHLLQTTALVHEAYLRVVRQEGVVPREPRHFLRVAVRAMRSVLVDHARRIGARKRGGGWGQVDLDKIPAADPQAVAPAVLDVDRALARLSVADPDRAEIVELRFFGGLSTQEIADALQLSVSTIERRWRSARAWIKAELGE